MAFNLADYINFLKLREELINSGAIPVLFTFLIVFAVIYTLILFLPIGEEEQKRKYALALGVISGFIAIYSFGIIPTSPEQLANAPVLMAYQSFIPIVVYLFIVLLFASVVAHAVLKEQGKKLPPLFAIILAVVIGYAAIKTFPSANEAATSNGLVQWVNNIIRTLTDPSFVAVILPFALMIAIVWYITTPPKKEKRKTGEKIRKWLEELSKFE